MAATAATAETSCWSPIAISRRCSTCRSARRRAPRTAPTAAAMAASARTAQDCVLRLPIGTLVRDADAPDDAEALGDLVEHDQRLVVARGGRGGRGNALLRDAHAPGARHGGARPRRREAPAALLAEADRRRRARRASERRQVDAAAPHLGGATARGGVPVHDAGARTRRRAGRRAALRRRGSARPDRGREPRRRARRPLPASRRAHARDRAPGRRRLGVRSKSGRPMRRSPTGSRSAPNSRATMRTSPRAPRSSRSTSST